MSTPILCKFYCSLHNDYQFATIYSGGASNFADETIRNLTYSSRVSLQGNTYDQKAERNCIGKADDTSYKHDRGEESKEVYKTSSLLNSRRSSAATDKDIMLNGDSSGSTNRGSGADNSVGKEDHRIGKLPYGESTGATDRLHNHIRSSPLITSPEMQRSRGIHDTVMQSEDPDSLMDHLTGIGIHRYSSNDDKNNDNNIGMVNISVESSVARNDNCWNMSDSEYNNAKSQQISPLNVDQVEPPLYERRKRFMQPTSIYSVEVDDNGDNDAERILISEPIRSRPGKIMELSEVRKMNAQVDMAYFFR